MGSCSSCAHYPQDDHCMRCIYDHEVGGNTKWEPKNNTDVIERKVIEDIKTEINQSIEEAWCEEKAEGLYEALEIINQHIKVMPIS